MDKSGRLVLPKGVREKIGAVGPVLFHIELVLDRIELVPVRAKSGRSAIKRKDGLWVVPSTGKPFSATEAVAEDRQDRIDVISKNRTDR